MPCSLVRDYQLIGGTCCLHLYGRHKMFIFHCLPLVHCLTCAYRSTLLLYLGGAQNAPGSQKICQASRKLQHDGHRQVGHSGHKTRLLQFEVQHICAVQHWKWQRCLSYYKTPTTRFKYTDYLCITNLRATYVTRGRQYVSKMAGELWSRNHPVTEVNIYTDISGTGHQWSFLLSYMHKWDLRFPPSSLRKMDVGCAQISLYVCCSSHAHWTSLATCVLEISFPGNFTGAFPDVWSLGRFGSFRSSDTPLSYMALNTEKIWIENTAQNSCITRGKSLLRI